MHWWKNSPVLRMSHSVDRTRLDVHAYPVTHSIESTMWVQREARVDFTWGAEFLQGFCPFLFNPSIFNLHPSFDSANGCSFCALDAL